MAVSIPIRNASFAFGHEVPRHWHGGRKSVTTFFDNMSVFFPAGERFFIASVRAHQRFVKEAALHADVRAFCGQEGVHSREHVRYNEMLKAQGYPVEQLETKVERLLGRVTRILPKRRQLAATCALEHFTSLMAHMLLRDPRVLGDAHPVMAALWKWHAVEENEHKAVAYDVFLAAGGTYFERCSSMMMATLIFWTRVFEHQFRLMRVDGTALSPREWAALFHFLWVSPGAMRGVFRLYFEYFRPDFHPNDIDSSDLIENWKREYGSQAYEGAA